MKVKVLLATLVATLMLGVQGFANPCDSACVTPCGACDHFVAKRGGDLFSGLKRLVNGVRANNCDPCDPVVACNPCDDVFPICNPCDEVCGTPRLGMGGRLRNLLASRSCNAFDACSPCDAAFDCGPCDFVNDCGPCDITDNGCSTPRFRPFRSLLNNLRSNQGCFTDCGPCDGVVDCGPCDIVGDCGPCDPNGCDTSCGPRGHLFELPRLNLQRLFGGLRSRCNDGGACDPCAEVRPCDNNCFR